MATETVKRITDIGPPHYEKFLPPIIEGALLSAVFIPFLKMEPPYEDLKELVHAMWELWAENGKNRERIGEFIQRIGLGNFLEQIGLEPVPEMISQPRTNPYVFYDIKKG